MTVHSTLWNPITLGPLTLPHRLAMSPMTRNRALPDGTPTTLDANYFAQRASFGLLFAGGTQPSAAGHLPERLRRGIALNRPDPMTFYGGDEHGYTDYPSLDFSATTATQQARNDERWCYERPFVGAPGHSAQ